MPFDQTTFPLPVVETDEVLRCLIAARAYLADGTKWRQFNVQDRRDGGCAINACSYTDAPCDVYLQAADELVAFVPPPFGCVGDYNDDPHTTHADVLALFDRAIAARRAALS